MVSLAAARHRDADACGDHRGYVVSTRHGAPTSSIDWLASAMAALDVLARRLQDAEFVAAESRDANAFSAKPSRSRAAERLQQAVADGMAERVVDVLEAVEIDEEDRRAARRSSARRPARVAAPRGT